MGTGLPSAATCLRLGLAAEEKARRNLGTMILRSRMTCLRKSLSTVHCIRHRLGIYIADEEDLEVTLPHGPS